MIAIVARPGARPYSAGGTGSLTWSDSGFGTPRNVVIASRVDW